MERSSKVAYPGEIEYRGVPQPREQVPGHRGPSGYRLRLANADDCPQVAALLTSHAPAIGERAERLLHTGIAAKLLHHRRSNSRQVLTDLADALLHDRLADVYAGLSVVLVGERRGGDIIATLMATPPVQEIKGWIEAGHDPHRVLMAALFIARIDASVLHDAAPADAGQALVSACVKLYDRNDYAILYGEADASDALPAAYRETGFKLLEPGQTMTLEPLLELPLLMQAEPDKRLFARWLTAYTL
jgi:hypothetical protein